MQAHSTSTSREPKPKRDRAAAVDRPDESRVSGCTCFRIRRLARRVTQIYDRVLAPSGIRVTQFSLLTRLLAGPIAIGPLAAALDMDRTTLSRNLKPLIDAGLVSLARGEGDARQRTVTLTATGRARYDDAKKLWRRAQNELNRMLGATQVASLHLLFDGLIETLNEKSA
jgi:DNA-binding MarR family transcriptional regulator